MNLQILQVKDGLEYRGYKFSSLRLLKNLGLTVDLNNYKIVYESDDLDDDYDNIYKVLETIYIKFQGPKPEGYKGHSLSVSDIVKLGDNYFFCDSFGFKKL